MIARRVLQSGEIRVQQSEQVMEGIIVARMRRCRQQQKMPRLVVRELAKQIEAPVASPSSGHRGMRFVDDNHLRASAQKVVEATLTLDEIQTDDGERICLEHADRIWQIALQPCGRRRRYRRRGDRELGFELRRPLVDEMRRAQDREPVDLAAINDTPGE